MKPRVLDLFCGAGGAAMGYYRAGFDVLGVDIRPQPDYPFEFYQADALEFLSEGIDKTSISDDFSWYTDVIHASPPCQRWSRKTIDREKHPDLITPLRPMLETTGLHYVIENVPGAPLRDPIKLCGSNFGLGVRRHRYFETTFPLFAAGRCRHSEQTPRFRLYDHGKWYLSGIVHVFGTGGGKGREHWREAMGIDWTDDTDSLREAIPPAYTEFIGHQLMQSLGVRPESAA